MNMIYKFLCNIPYIITIIFSLTSYLSAPPNETEISFTASVTFEDETTEFTGTDAFYTNTPSMYSIMFKSDEINCGHHFTSLQEKLTIGTYRVQYEQSPRFGAVCILPEAEKPERLASESGEITIYELTSDKVEGSFDIVFVGGITGKQYKIQGRFSALSMAR